jgi:hypothetical protein
MIPSYNLNKKGRYEALEIMHVERRNEMLRSLISPEFVGCVR